MVRTYKMYHPAKGFSAIVITVDCLRMLSRTVSPNGALPADLVGAIEYSIGPYRRRFRKLRRTKADRLPRSAPPPAKAHPVRGRSEPRPGGTTHPPRADPGRLRGATVRRV